MVEPIRRLSILNRAARPVMPYNIAEEDVLAEQQAQEEEGSTNLFFRLLEVPGRLLGGQSIQGALEGGFEDGFAEGARKAFINNPINQVIEGVSNLTEPFGFDLAEGVGDFFEMLGLKEEGSRGLVEDTNFGKIREAAGWEQYDNAAAEFGVNLLGELVTSPIELFFTPFGLTKAGYAAKAARGTKGVEEAAEAAVKIAKAAGMDDKAQAAVYQQVIGGISADLTKATEAGMKAMVAFKVPFKDIGYSFQPFKNLDIGAARVIQGTANWLNTNPITSSLARAFNAKQVAVADPEVRYAAGIALDAGEASKRELESIFNVRLRRILDEAPEIARRNPRFQKIAATMVEVGVRGTDEKYDILRLFGEGRSLHRAKSARADVIRGATDDLVTLEDGSLASRIADDAEDVGFLSRDADGNIGRFVTANEHPFEEIQNAIDIGSPDDLRIAVKRWQAAFPNAQLPREVFRFAGQSGVDGLADIGIKLRRGVDVVDDDGFKARLSDPEIEDAIQDARPSFGARDTREAGINIRGQVARDEPGTLDEVVQNVRTRELPEILRELEGMEDGEQLLKQFQDMSESLLDLGEELGDKDLADGIINGALEKYLPRDLTPEVREAIEGQWSKINAGRELDELTVVEANAYLAEYGVKLTKFRSVDDLMKNGGEEAVNDLWAKVFPDKFVNGLKALWNKNGDETAKAMAEFFDTNPSRQWYRRIEKSAQTRQTRAFNQAMLEQGSPMVYKESTVGEVLRSMDDTTNLFKKGFRALALTTKGDRGQYTQINALDNNKILAEGLALQEAAKDREATEFFTALIDEALKKPNADIEEYLTELQTVVRNRNIKVTNKRSLKGGGKSQSALDRAEASVDAIRSGPFKDTPLARNLDAQAELLRTWDAQGLDALSDAERSAIAAGSGKEIYAERIKTTGAQIENLKARRRVYDDQIKDARKRGVPKDSAEWEHLIERRDRLRSEIKDVESKRKSLRNDKKGHDALLNQAKEKQALSRDKALRTLEQKENGMRNLLQIRIDNIRKDLDSFRGMRDLHKSDLKTTKRRIRSSTSAARSDIANSTKSFNDRFSVYLTQKQHGAVPLENLMEANPVGGQSVLEKGARNLTGDLSTQRVVWVDGQHYKEILDPKDGLLARMNRPDYLANSLAWFDNATNIWKAWTTLPNFAMATRMRDYATNFIMQVQGGMRPSALMNNRSLWKFNSKLNKALGKGAWDELASFVPDEALRKATGTENGLDLFQFLYREGVISPNLIKDQTVIEAGTRFIDVTEAMPLSEVKTIKDGVKALSDRLGTKNSIIRSGTRLAERLDDQSKMMAFFDHVAQGKSAEEAAAIARKWAYDPRRVSSSQFEKTVLKRFIPFYSYARFAVKTQVEAYFTKPGTVSFWGKVNESARQLSGLSENEMSLILPDFIQDNFGVTTSKTDDGIIKVRMFGSSVPLGEIGKLANAIEDTFDPEKDTGIFTEFGSRMNPFIKVPVENAVNASFFTQRPIAKFEGEKVEYLGVQMDAKLAHTFRSIRFLNEIDRLGVIDKKVVDALLDGNLEGTRNAKGENLADRFLGSAFSPTGAAGRPLPQDIGEQAGYAIGRQEREISRLNRDIRRRMVREQETGVSEEENIRALRDGITKRLARIRTIQGAQSR